MLGDREDREVRGSDAQEISLPPVTFARLPVRGCNYWAVEFRRERVIPGVSTRDGELQFALKASRDPLVALEGAQWLDSVGAKKRGVKFRFL